MLLMEVMPSVLAKRSFPAPQTLRQLEPGYRDAPEPGDNCVIVFSRVRSTLNPWQWARFQSCERLRIRRH